MAGKINNFKIKKPPVQPKRIVIKESKYYNEFSRLDDVIAFFQKKNIALSDVKLNYNYFVWNEYESDESYNIRYEKYNEALEEHKIWEKANEKQIQQCLAARKEKARKKKAAEAQLIINKINSLQKKLSKKLVEE